MPRTRNGRSNGSKERLRLAEPLGDTPRLTSSDVGLHLVGRLTMAATALVFDEDAEQEARLVAAVRGRPPGQDVIDAVEAHLLDERLLRGDDPRLCAFVAMVAMVERARLRCATTSARWPHGAETSLSVVSAGQRRVVTTCSSDAEERWP